MNPSIWGPHAWWFLHSITFNYPKCPTPHNKESMRAFFENLHNILPCDSCCQNYKQHLSKLPLTNKILSSRDTLVKWLIDLHNLVNESTGKPTKSYEEVFNEYTKGYEPENKCNRTYMILNILILVVVLLVGGYLLYHG